MTRIAVLGAGIAGLSTAHRLHTAQAGVHVTLLEAGEHFGGHANTVDVTLPDAQGRPVTHGVDTGFLVFNHRTYPMLKQLFAQLGVPTAASDMSFSVQIPEDGEGAAAARASGLRPGLVWCGTDLDSVFAQRRNLFSPAFLRMLWDLTRFNRLCTRMAQDAELNGDDEAMQQSVGDFLRTHGFSAAFADGYFLPMVACIWSCPTEQMLRFPMATMIRFCHNHGLLQVADRPQWYTVQGGSREYVRRITSQLPDARLRSPVQALSRHSDGKQWLVHTPHGIEAYDQVVLATHADTSLGWLRGAGLSAHSELLSAVRFHDNMAVLHTDRSLLPAQEKAWAAWNYERATSPHADHQAVCLHYLINRLQPLPWQQPVVVSLNPLRQPDPSQVLARFDYAHPIFDQAAIDAQKRLPALQGQDGIWLAGAWTGYGFHEDGLRSGVQVADALLQRHRAGAPQGSTAAPSSTTAPLASP